MGAGKGYFSSILTTSQRLLCACTMFLGQKETDTNLGPVGSKVRQSICIKNIHYYFNCIRDDFFGFANHKFLVPHAK